jgi:arylsulfatase A-like enzyme/Flp pilus assembly protein TadD
MITTGFRKIRIVFFIAVIAIAGVWFAFYCRKSVKNVILISIDTCRADYLSCYGYERKTTPNIDAVAEQGVLFKNVVSPVPLTLPAHSSMLTGTIPPYHQVHDNLNYKFGQDNLTIAETLKKHGYTTGAIVSSFILDSQFGLDQGFDEYNDHFVEALSLGEYIERRGAEASLFACEWLSKHRKEKFFLFLHYYDPHTPYEPPEPFATDYAENLYGGEISYVDRCIGQVIAKLKSLGLYDSTLLIITGDHGELLGEHGELEHGYLLYEGAIKVPLIISSPRIKKPRIINKVVGLVDIVPTILGYLEVPSPPDIQGKDLCEYINSTDSPIPERYIYCESFTPTKYDCNPLLSVVTNQWKYIETTRPELYDLKQDPDEEENLLTAEPKRTELLQYQLRRILSEHARTDKEESSFMLDAESKRRLESLGYIGSMVVQTSFEVDPSRADPKDFVDYHVYNQKAVFMLFKKEYEKTKAICYEMLEKWPQIIDTHFLLGRVTFSAGDYKESVIHNLKYLDLLEKEKAQNPQHKYDLVKPIFMVHNLLGSSFCELGEYDKAIEQFKATIQIRPKQADVLYRLGTAYYQQGKLEETINSWSEALRIDPTLPGAHGNLQKLLAEKQRRDRIISHYVEILRQNPGDPNAHNTLANELYRQGKIKDAIAHWLEVVKQRPDWAEVRNNLGTAFYRQGKNEEAINYWKEVVKLDPNWPEPRNNLAWLLATIDDERLRNPAEAVRLAEQACELTDYNKPEMLDTLSVAYAAVGRFTEAVRTAERGIELAREAKDEKTAESIYSRLQLYKKDKPYHE